MPAFAVTRKCDRFQTPPDEPAEDKTKNAKHENKNSNYHPVNALYNAVRETVKGASCGCAEVFGAAKSVEACGLPLLKDKALAGTPGISNLRTYLADGWRTLVF